MKNVILPTAVLALASFGFAFFYAQTAQPVGAIPTLPTQAHTVAGERVTVEQRGNSVRAQFPWKGEQGIAVSYDMGAATPAEIAKGKRNRQVITEQLNDTDFKIDIILDEKPNTNVFCYNIENHQDYDFFYQPALTPEEIAEGASRPEHIVGSYAVYHKTLKNHVLGEQNYATGKVMHIPRPEVWEVNNKEATRQWADLSYNNGQLCVTADQSFLDNATYPVRIDPTFGYTAAGASQLTVCFESETSNRIGLVASTTENGTLDSVSAYMRTDNGSGKSATTSFLVNEVDSVAANSHGEIASAEDFVAYSNTTALETINLSSQSITAATDYVISATCNSDTFGISDDIEVSYDTGVGTYYTEQWFSTGSSYEDSLENPWTDSPGTARPSIYATYTATPAATVTNNLSISGDVEIKGDMTIN